MTDPAIEAAQRAWQKRVGHNEPDPYFAIDKRHLDEIDAARESLAPLRAWYERWEGANPDEFDDFYPMLDSVKALIYPSEEL